MGSELQIKVKQCTLLIQFPKVQPHTENGHFLTRRNDSALLPNNSVLPCSIVTNIKRDIPPLYMMR